MNSSSKVLKLIKLAVGIRFSVRHSYDCERLCEWYFAVIQPSTPRTL